MCARPPPTSTTTSPALSTSTTWPRRSSNEKTAQFLPIEVIAARLGAAGIDLKREIVVYGSPGSSYAYFAQFALEYFGATRVQVFHMGVDGWKTAKRAVSTAAVTRKPVKIRPFANPAMLATTGEVVARVGNPGVQFVDVRRLGEFNGDESETLHGGPSVRVYHASWLEYGNQPDALVEQ